MIKIIEDYIKPYEVRINLKCCSYVKVFPHIDGYAHKKVQMKLSFHYNFLKLRKKLLTS